MALHWERTLAFVEKNCRPLEYHWLRWILDLDGAAPVAEALQTYQNSDGGFGGGLEPDFWLPDSSPMATSRALQITAALPADAVRPLEERALAYLESTFHRPSMGWEPVPEQVNDFPHAPWWSYPAAPGQHWGNPSAELIAQCARLQPESSFWTGTAVSYVRQQLLSLTPENTEEHELYCYARCVQTVPELRSPNAVEHLAKLATEHTAWEPAEWRQYRPQPLHYVTEPDHVLAPYFHGVLERNIAFWVESADDNGVWQPTWSWGQFENEWQQARLHWIGILAAERARVLRAFQCLS